MGLIQYIKRVWAKGDFVHPSDMNHIEDGVEAACNGVDIISENMEDCISSGEEIDTTNNGKIIQLKNFLKTLNIFPYTLTKAVYDEETGKRLDVSLNELNSNLSSLLMTKTQTFSQQNVSAGAQLTVSEKVNTYDGYKCIGIVGYSTGHVFVECSTCEYQSTINSIYMVARNNHSSISLEVTPRATLLYQKII